MAALQQSQLAMQQAQATMLQTLAVMQQSHAQYEKDMPQMRREGDDLKRAADERFARIEAILLEHNHMLSRLADTVGEKSASTLRPARRKPKKRCAQRQVAAKRRRSLDPAASAPAAPASGNARAPLARAGRPGLGLLPPGED